MSAQRRLRAGRRSPRLGSNLLWLLIAAWMLLACNGKKQPTPPTVASEPSLRLFVLSSVAGALEPCGCQKDMLGGADHAAALIEKQRSGARSTLVVGAGPMLFMDPKVDPEKKAQDHWKAEALAQSYKSLGLRAWAPGHNDWALGAAALAKLRKQSGAALLGANLEGETAGAVPGSLVEVAGFKVGLLGGARPQHRGRAPTGVTAKELQPALEQARDKLKAQGAQLFVALVAVDRGEAKRLAELVTGLHVLVVGKAYDEGDGNDQPTPPELIGKTLVVQTPNHLQAVAVVDLYVRDGKFEFQDGSGIAAMEDKQSLERRIADLERRIRAWEQPGSAATPADVAARKNDLKKLKTRLAALAAPTVPKTGSYLRYALEEVRESRGSEAAVAARMLGYYKRVNEHNRVVLADHTAPPVESGQPSYVGINKCSTCHAEEKKFWDGTSHARAYNTLKIEFKEYNLDCVGCHVTGYERPGGSTVTHNSGLVDVQCETCHGPGSAHAAEPGKAGLITRTPSRSLCGSQCHHEPHVAKSWDVNQAWPKITGPGHGM